MGYGKRSNMARFFNDGIGFLKWASIPLDEVKRLMGYDERLKRVLISPDVNSLQVLWEESDGAFAHQVADYDDNKTRTLTGE